MRGGLPSSLMSSSILDQVGAVAMLAQMHSSLLKPPQPQVAILMIRASQARASAVRKTRHDGVESPGKALSGVCNSLCHRLGRPDNRVRIVILELGESAAQLDALAAEV